MHDSFLPLLMDPQTRQPLTLNATQRSGEFVIEGTLESLSNSYPIVRGVPRFAGFQQNSNYTSSFGYKWCKWSRIQFESENIGCPMEGHTRGMWEKITGIADRDLKGAIMLESGCGPGRFLDIVASKNGKAIGVDLSDAVEAAQENFANNPNVLICQGDALQLPIKSSSLDGAFSIGVLHHTPDPFKGFQQMCQAVRPGGDVSVAVYPKGGYYDFPTVQLYRALFKALWPVLKHYPPLIYSYLTAYGLRPTASVPLLGKLLRAVFPHVRLPDVRWALLDTFDSVTPSYQSAHKSYEVFRWLKDCNLVDIEPGDWGTTTYHGVTPSAVDSVTTVQSRAA
ncbi:MAG: hypothetical protein CMJ78_27385 [Planctomycetaceae bacterium]|nr:hypothetical protein [Planctomycetaceae bacterium]